MREMLARRFEKSTDIVTRKISGETVLVPISRKLMDVDCIYTLDEVGSFIWEQLDDQTPLTTVVTAIVGEYDVEKQRAQDDLVELVEQLANTGAIKEVEPG